MPGSFNGKGTPITTADFVRSVTMLGGDEAALWTVLAVETRGFGFLPDRRPKILFERHIFADRTKGRFSAFYPDISNPMRGSYSGGPAEYSRLTKAMLLDETAALQSASWGLGQVMGFNAATVGFKDVDALVTAMVEGEAAQLMAATRFITGQPALLRAYKARDWASVAFYYNGKDYAKNHYDLHLQESYASFSAGALPRIDIRTAQACLQFLGVDPHGVDGVAGQGFTVAVNTYRASWGLPRGPLDVALLARLTSEAGI